MGTMATAFLRGGVATPSGRPCGRPSLRHRERAARVVRRRARFGEGKTFDGAYGRWEVERSDVAEVALYRAGIATSALGSALAAWGLSFDTTPQWEDGAAVVAIAGFGVSLRFIHIYIKEVKAALTFLWALGFAGFIALALRDDCASVPQFVAEHRWGVWLVGPFFASLTGVSFKEGMCYSSTQAFVLMGLTPALLLGHLTGALDGGPLEAAAVASWVAAFAWFSAGKFVQPVAEDIGDKSVFEFLALSEEQQEARLRANNRGADQ